MGLDMYLFKVNRLNNKEISTIENKHTNEIGADFQLISAEGFEESPELYKDLENLARKIKIKKTHFEYDRCCEDHNINKDDALIGRCRGHNYLKLDFASGAQIELKEEKYKSYLKVVDTEVYIFKCKKVAYWRKDYDLDNFFSNMFTVENCGYHKLSNENKQELKEYIRKYQPEDFKHNLDIKLLSSKSSNLFYYAWW